MLFETFFKHVWQTLSHSARVYIRSLSKFQYSEQIPQLSDQLSLYLCLQNSVDELGTVKKNLDDRCHIASIADILNSLLHLN